MGYKMNNGSKNYTIKSYRDGGLVKTTSYKDGGKVEKDEESYTTTFRRGLENNRVTKENPYGPFVFGGTTNVIKRVLGMDYDKDKPKSK